MVERVADGEARTPFRGRNKNWCWGEKEDEKGACSRRTPPNHVSYDGIYLLRDLRRGHETK